MGCTGSSRLATTLLGTMDTRTGQHLVVQTMDQVTTSQALCMWSVIDQHPHVPSTATSCDRLLRRALYTFWPSRFNRVGSILRPPEARPRVQLRPPPPTCGSSTRPWSSEPCQIQRNRVKHEDALKKLGIDLVKEWLDNGDNDAHYAISVFSAKAEKALKQ